MAPVTDFGWVAAAVAPWAVSPHPNFGVDRVEPHSLVGLITEFRQYEIEKHWPKMDEESPAWVREVLDALAGSTTTEHQHPSTVKLTQLSRDRQLSVGVRAACALYASVAWAEMEDPDSAIVLLSQILSDLRKQADTILASSGSFKLIIAILHLQLAVRLYEVNNYDSAKLELRQLHMALPSQTTKNYETFSISLGLQWSAKRLQLEILRLLKNNAIRLKSQMETFEGDSWVQVVRSVPTWIDIRSDWASAKRDNQYISDLLDLKTQSASGRQRIFSHNTGLEAGLSALLVSELSGDIGRIQKNRSDLGRVRIMEKTESTQAIFSYTEAIRLMRHSRDKEGLSAALSLGSTDWDARVLQNSMKSLVNRPRFPEYVRDIDLQVLESTVDLMSPSDLTAVLEAVWQYLELPRGSGLHSFSGEESCFKVLRQALAILEDHNHIADRMLLWVQASDSLYFSQASAVESVVSRLNTKSLDARVRTGWVDWATSISTGANDEVRRVARAVLRKLGHVELESLAEGLNESELAMEILQSESSTLDDALVRRLVPAFVSILGTAREQARSSYRTVGGIDQAELAVALAVRLKSAKLWKAIVDFVVDPAVNGNMKAAALERITNNLEAIPENVLYDLRIGWREFSESSRFAGLMDGEPFRHFPEAIRFAAKSKAAPGSLLLEQITDLASDSFPRSRIEAAKSARALSMENGDAEWALSLLLQLTRDSDSVVRAEAGQSLAALSYVECRLSALVTRRLMEMLGDPSVRLPLAIAHGLQIRVDDFPLPQGSEIHKKLVFISENHPSVIVQKAAGLAMKPKPAAN